MVDASDIRDWLKRYTIDGQSIRTIAAAVGSSYHTVRRCLIAAGADMRTRGSGSHKPDCTCFGCRVRRGGPGAER